MHKLTINHNLKAFNSQIVNEYDSRPLTQKLSQVVPKLLLAYPELPKDFDQLDVPDDPHQQDQGPLSKVFTKNKVLMDFACGTGIITEKLYPHVKSLIGIDINQHVLGIFNKRLTEKYENVTSHLVDILEDKEGSPEASVVSLLIGKVDIITCTISYHHLGDYEAVTAKLAQFLTTSGMLFILDFYNPNVEQLGDDRVSANEAVTHMGGLKKLSLIDTLTKSGLVNVKVHIIPGFKSWYHEQFIKTHCAQALIDQLNNDQLPKKTVNDQVVYYIDIDLVLAVGERPKP